MKIIHTADIHLASKLDSKFDKVTSSNRKVELRTTFKRLIDYAKKENINYILLSGDIFDSDNPSKSDKDYFYGAIRSNPNITFFYLKGNHDISNTNVEEYDNLKVFSNEWNYYYFDNVCICGIELSTSNSTSMYSTLTLNENNVNIVMIHGQIGSTSKDINLLKLRNKNIDYLALGHIHKYQKGTIDDRASYAYSGCLEPRGFDEIGEKGFIELEINDRKINHKFIPFSKRTISQEKVDISTFEDAYSIISKIEKEIDFVSDNIYRIILTGEVDIDIDDIKDDIYEAINDKAYFINIIDETTKVFDIHKYDYDVSIKGEFVRTVYANNDYSEEEKIKIITLGLKALDKKGVE